MTFEKCIHKFLFLSWGKENQEFLTLYFMLPQVSVPFHQYYTNTPSFMLDKRKTENENNMRAAAAMHYSSPVKKICLHINIV